ncbi:hypothetical protein DFJ58DRAFT_225895 [Suillus subalutaceus]|uniref:uncharacterized protein n=1 Tax=Suillus subalutaceus TaxID=48586 RepID=UPI001B85D8E4|nr:uncharacterized protein DFJ58DRAFT_225895 [Suillus subalutaceus]KAG1862766.1 hypothetical protein DFJ58DRAFT_225895 [Suillus subalutaceus]
MLFYTPNTPNHHQTFRKDEFYVLLSSAGPGVITPQGRNQHLHGVRDHARAHKVLAARFKGISQHMADALLVNP